MRLEARTDILADVFDGINRDNAEGITRKQSKVDENIEWLMSQMEDIKICGSYLIIVIKDLINGQS